MVMLLPMMMVLCAKCRTGNISHRVLEALGPGLKQGEQSMLRDLGCFTSIFYFYFVFLSLSLFFPAIIHLSTFIYLIIDDIHTTLSKCREG